MPKETGPSLKKASALLALQFLSDFGDQITQALLALCLLDITKSTGEVGFVYFITTVSYVIFTFAGGLLGDHLCRHVILVYSKIGRGIVVLLLILAVQQQSVGFIYATTFLLSILSSFHGPAKISTWAVVIPTKHLERYNSLSELSIQSSMILGPLIASFFVLRGWINAGFAVDAVTFFLCAVIFSKIVARANAPSKLTAGGARRDFLRGFKFIARHPEIARFFSYDAIQMLGFGAFNATFVVLAQRDFGWGKLDYSYHLSIVAAFTTLGALLGSTSFVMSINAITKLIACAVISAITLWLALSIGSFPLTSVLIGICDALSIFTLAATRTKVQMLAKSHFPEALASIIASRSIIIKGTTLLGIASCLIVDDYLSLASTLKLFVAPIMLCAVPFIISAVRDPLAHPTTSKLAK